MGEISTATLAHERARQPGPQRLEADTTAWDDGRHGGDSTVEMTATAGSLASNRSRASRMGSRGRAPDMSLVGEGVAHSDDAALEIDCESPPPPHGALHAGPVCEARGHAVFALGRRLGTAPRQVKHKNLVRVRFVAHMIQQTAR